MYKYLSILLISLVCSGCVYKQNNVLILDKERNISFNQTVENTNDFCAIDSYISNIQDEKYGKLFVEYIDLQSDCHWNGYERGFFVYEFKNKLKLKSMDTIERLDYKNYEFSTYLIDEKYYLNLIFKYDVTLAIFILDYEGKLSSELIKGFDKNYETKFLNSKRFTKDYNQSLVRRNAFFSYFGKSGQSDDFISK